jgi:hypothetical protein
MYQQRHRNQAPSGIPSLYPNRDRHKNNHWFVEQKNGADVREYVGCDRLCCLEELALLTAVYRPLVPLLNFFMPTQTLASTTKVYAQPRSPFQRLLEFGELPWETKDIPPLNGPLHPSSQLFQTLG